MTDCYGITWLREQYQEALRKEQEASAAWDVFDNHQTAAHKLWQDVETILREHCKSAYRLGIFGPHGPFAGSGPYPEGCSYCVHLLKTCGVLERRWRKWYDSFLFWMNEFFTWQRKAERLRRSMTIHLRECPICNENLYKTIEPENREMQKRPDTAGFDYIRKPLQTVPLAFPLDLVAPVAAWLDEGFQPPAPSAPPPDPAKRQQIFDVGPDELSELDGILLPEDMTIIYYYEAGDYDGSGIAVIIQGDRLWEYGLGHCSCYGPCDDFLNYVGCTHLVKTNGDGTPIASIDWTDATTFDYDEFPGLESKVKEVCRDLFTDGGVPE